MKNKKLEVRYTEDNKKAAYVIEVVWRGQSELDKATQDRLIASWKSGDSNLLVEVPE